MPSPERPPQGESEQEPTPYYRASRFSGEKPAGRAYRKAERVIFNTKADVDLSAYRFHVDRIWHVAVLGEQPPDELDQTIQWILSTGEATILPEPILTLLQERRIEQSKRGSWVESHYRPGKPL